MIKYSLLCEDAHAFEAWFRDSEAFDEQSRGGRIECPHCGSDSVQKAMMAPAIVRSPSRRKPAGSSAPAQVPVAMEGPAPAEDEKFRHMRSLLRELHSRVKESSEDVGRSFPTEARKIHDGDIPARSIHGTATTEEVKSLLEDGVGVLPLPPLPDDLN